MNDTESEGIAEGNAARAADPSFWSIALDLLEGNGQNVTASREMLTELIAQYSETDIPLEKNAEIWRQAFPLDRDPVLCVKILQLMRPYRKGVSSSEFLHLKSFGEFAEWVTGFQALQANGIYPKVVGEQYCLTFVPSSYQAPIQQILGNLAIAVGMLSMMVDKNNLISHIRLSMPEPDWHETLTEAFGVPLKFGEAVNAVVFYPGSMKIPLGS